MTRDAGLADALTGAGLDVVVYAGWPTRGDAGFNPQGLVWHHTGPWSTIDAIVQLCIHGRPDLAGPLCQLLIDPVGTCHVIAAGKANHAGPGGWRGLAGNSTVYGIEAIHDGDPKTPWPTGQVDAMVLAAAALARHAQFGPQMCCGHREWAPRRKVDPTSLDLEVMRTRVALQLAAWGRPVPVAVPLPSIPAPVPAPVHDFEEATVKSTLLHITLDGAGNGWVAWDPGFNRDPVIVGAIQLGPSPADEGGADPYWMGAAHVNLSAQPRAGKMVVVARGGPAGGTVGVWASCS